MQVAGSTMPVRASILMVMGSQLKLQTSFVFEDDCSSSGVEDSQRRWYNPGVQTPPPIRREGLRDANAEMPVKDWAGGMGPGRRGQNLGGPQVSVLGHHVVLVTKTAGG
jgi:hypothetical protein